MAVRGISRIPHPGHLPGYAKVIECKTACLGDWRDCRAVRGGGDCPFSRLAAAYAYADGEGKIPREIIWSSYGDRFGFAAVFGRQPTPGEMRRMSAAERIVRAYRSRLEAENWVQWAKDNEDDARLLNQAMKAAMDGDE